MSLLIVVHIVTRSVLKVYYKARSTNSLQSKIRSSKSLVHSLQSKIRSPKSVVQNPQFKVCSPKSVVQNPQFKVCSPNPIVQNPQSKVHSIKYNLLPGTSDYGLWTMAYGLWTMDFGLWTGGMQFLVLLALQYSLSTDLVIIVVHILTSLEETHQSKTQHLVYG